MVAPQLFRNLPDVKQTVKAKVLPSLPSCPPANVNLRRRSTVPICRSPPPSLVSAQIIGATKGKHFAYILNVAKGPDQWTVYRRYSEFRLFRNQVLRALSSQKNCGQGSCSYLEKLRFVEFPRKHLFHANDNVEVTKQRTLKLDLFLQFLLVIVEKCEGNLRIECSEHCVISKLVKGFLGLVDDDSEPAMFYPAFNERTSTSKGKIHRRELPPATVPKCYTFGIGSKGNCNQLHTILEGQEMHLALAA